MEENTFEEYQKEKKIIVSFSIRKKTKERLIEYKLKKKMSSLSPMVDIILTVFLDNEEKEEKK